MNCRSATGSGCAGEAHAAMCPSACARSTASLQRMRAGFSRRGFGSSSQPAAAASPLAALRNLVLRQVDDLDAAVFGGGGGLCVLEGVGAHTGGHQLGAGDAERVAQ